MKNIIHTKQKGFTILESLVSIAILAVAVTGPLVYVTNSFQAAEVARDQTVAFFLAQDAVERIKNIRDNNGINLSREQWMNGLDACFDTNGCRFDYSSKLTPEVCPGGNCGKLYQYGENTAFTGYGYNTGGTSIESPFTRKVEIDEIVSDEEVKVTVTITWQTRGNDRQVVVTEHIFNWHNSPVYEG